MSGSAASTESILPTDDTTVRADVAPPHSKPFIGSFQELLSYTTSFLILILAWCVAGVAWYDLLARNDLMYSIFYVFWAFPVIGLLWGILTGSSVAGSMGTIISGTFFILILQGVLTLVYGFDLRNSPLEPVLRALP